MWVSSHTVPGAPFQRAHTATCGCALRCGAHPYVYLSAPRAPEYSAFLTTSTVSVFPGGSTHSDMLRRWKAGCD